MVPLLFEQASKTIYDLTVSYMSNVTENVQYEIIWEKKYFVASCARNEFFISGCTFGVCDLLVSGCFLRE